ncbi:MAG TPA: ABC transporter permease subunit [Candidatus Saccharimonadales bacterium]
MSSPLLAITRSELKRRKFYLLWWAIGLIVLIAFIVLAYAAVKGQADQLNKAFSGLSSTAGSFFGASDMFTPVGYMNSQLFYITLPILFIILSVTLAGSLTSKDERHHTLELLLARPISRTRLLLAKMLAAIIIVATLGVITAGFTILCSLLAGLHISANHLTLTTLWTVLFSGAFGAIAFMLHAAAQRTRKAAAVAAILLSLGGYILASIGSMVHGIAWFAELLPYHYFDSSAMLRGHVPTGLIVYVAAMYAVALLVSIAGFRRRDIN